MNSEGNDKGETLAYDDLVRFFRSYLDSLRAQWGSRDVRYLMVEGNIGAGKTTLLSKIKSDNVYIIPEPLKYWQGVLVKQTGGDSVPETTNLFELFYECLKFEKSAIIVIFQIVALFSRLTYLVDNVLKRPNTKLFVSERSFLSDRFCIILRYLLFARVLYYEFPAYFLI